MAKNIVPTPRQLIDLQVRTSLPTAAEMRTRTITVCGAELKEALDVALAEIQARADAKNFNAGVTDARGLREALEHLGYKVVPASNGTLRVRW